MFDTCIVFFINFNNKTYYSHRLSQQVKMVYYGKQDMQRQSTIVGKRLYIWSESDRYKIGRDILIYQKYIWFVELLKWNRQLQTSKQYLNQHVKRLMCRRTLLTTLLITKLSCNCWNPRKTQTSKVENPKCRPQSSIKATVAHTPKSSDCRVVPGKKYEVYKRWRKCPTCLKTPSFLSAYPKRTTFIQCTKSTRDLKASRAIDAEATGWVQQGRLLRLDILHLKILKTGFRGALSAVKISKNAEGLCPSGKIECFVYLAVNPAVN